MAVQFQAQKAVRIAMLAKRHEVSTSDLVRMCVNRALDAVVLALAEVSKPQDIKEVKTYEA